MSRTVVWNAFFLLVNAVKPISAISASEIQRWSSSSQIASVYLIGVQAAAGIVEMAGQILLATLALGQGDAGTAGQSPCGDRSFED
ncbi:hypothetical protein OG255_45865 (plasmid) [Streptomyces sp. NBC_01455]|nr:hypothetical protein [Streptomyces sp. NBC_01455]